MIEFLCAITVLYYAIYPHQEGHILYIGISRGAGQYLSEAKEGSVSLNHFQGFAKALAFPTRLYKGSHIPLGRNERMCQLITA